MTNKLRNILNFKFKEKHFYQLFLILLFTALFCLFYFNQTTLVLLSNGFSSVFNKNLQVYYFYVGQGDSSLIIFPDDTTMLIDTGTVENASNLTYQLSVVLENNKLTDIDYLILTHPHEDHIGGAVEVLENFQVNYVYRPKINSTCDLDTYNGSYTVNESDLYSQTILKAFEEPNCQIKYIEPESLRLGSCIVQFWTPNKNSYSDLNSYSPIMTVQGDDKTFMFTADATDVTEREFLNCLEENNISVDVDFLKVAHHGSKNSTSNAFIEAISPSYAFISAGINNIYNHPSIETLERLQSKVFGTYVTADLGLIAVGVTNGTYSIAYSSANFDLPLLVVCYLCAIFATFNFNITKLPKNRVTFMKNGIVK